MVTTYWWGLSKPQRKGHHEPREIPADEQARYEAALAGLKALEDYEHTEWGGPDYGTEVPPPPAYEWVWDEPEEEWNARWGAYVAERREKNAYPFFA